MSGTKLHDGSTKSFLNVVKAWCASGNTATIVCPDREGLFEYVNSGAIKGATAVALPYTYNILPFKNSFRDYLLYLPRLIKRWGRNRMGAKALYKYCAGKNVSFIHSNTSVNNIGYIAAKRLNIPHVWHIREYGDRDFKMIVPFQHKMFVSPNNYVICITKDILKYKKLTAGKNIRQIYNGIMDVSNFRINENNGNYFLYAGKVSELKGIFDLIEGYRIYYNSYSENSANSKDPLPLKVAGEVVPEIKNDLQEKIKSLPIELLGSRDDISDLMYESAAVIVPSKFEGFGRVMPEAMSNGCVVIGRDTGGMKEQFDNGKEMLGREIGLRFENVSQLADKLSEVSGRSKKDYIPMIKDAQNVVGQLYSIESSCKSILNFYNEILSRPVLTH